MEGLYFLGVRSIRFVLSRDFVEDVFWGFSVNGRGIINLRIFKVSS